MSTERILRVWSGLAKIPHGAVLRLFAEFTLRCFTSFSMTNEGLRGTADDKPSNCHSERSENPSGKQKFQILTG
jgi:hypothetical protein